MSALSPATVAGSPTDELSLKEALRIAGWPTWIASAPDKEPHIVQSLREFEELLLFAPHLDRICVLRDGVSRLAQEGALPRQVANAASGETDVRRFLAKLGDDEDLQRLRGRVYVTPPGLRDERELTQGRDGVELCSLAEKRAELEHKDERGGVYLAELRRANKYRHEADGRYTKTLLARGVCDWVGRKRAMAMPYWDRYDEGIFVGGRFAGSPMHVDQIMWSNVGKNFAGHKLLAAWEYGEASRQLFDEHAYSLFQPPLSPSEIEAIGQAAQIALLGPGDLFIFSGGKPSPPPSHSPLTSHRPPSPLAIAQTVEPSPFALTPHRLPSPLTAHRSPSPLTVTAHLSLPTASAHRSHSPLTVTAHRSPLTSHGHRHRSPLTSHGHRSPLTAHRHRSPLTLTAHPSLLSTLTQAMPTWRYLSRQSCQSRRMSPSSTCTQKTSARSSTPAPSTTTGSAARGSLCSMTSRRK